MGQGFIYKCSKCELETMVTLGVGMLFPDVYQDVLEDAKAGKYGSEWKELANKSEFVAVDATQKFYLCPRCGNWKVDYDLSLYEPFDEDHIRSKQYGIKTVAEWGDVPYASPQDLSNDYSEIAHYVHKCDKCDSAMLEVKEKQFDHLQEIKLKCPQCGELNEINNMILWD